MDGAALWEWYLAAACVILVLTLVPKIVDWQPLAPPPEPTPLPPPPVIASLSRIDSSIIKAAKLATQTAPLQPHLAGTMYGAEIWALPVGTTLPKGNRLPLTTTPSIS